ncbi:MAG: DUF4424 family protein [Magnetococcales bacterium]|nr:DUF4424 family protein [Magnetococcales bacterium]
MKETKRSLGTMLAAWLILTGNALANDGIGELGVGGVVAGKTDRVYLRKEVLEVSLDRIKVAYEFINRSDAPVTLPVMFPLPRYGPLGEENRYQGEPEAFSVRIDGVRRAHRTNVRAVHCPRSAVERPCRDVTAALKKIGLTDRQMAYFTPEASPFAFLRNDFPKPLARGQVEALRKQGLMEMPQEKDASPMPLWEVEVTYLWEVTFPPRKVVEVEHAYRPFPARGGAATPDESALRERFCAEKGILDFWNRIAPEDRFDAGPNIEYILTTANTWAGPIEDFTLILKKSTPKELISLCFPGTATRIDPLTLEFRLKNFKPERELNVLFLNGLVADIRSKGQAPEVAYEQE